MIVYLKNDEIDREQWDNCIVNSSAAKPYPFSWYLDIMSPGWEALIDDDYDSVFPLTSRVRFGVQYVLTPPFIQQLGAFSPDKPPAEAIIEFLDYMPEIFKFTDISVNQKVDYPGYKVFEKANHEISLSHKYERIREGYSAECCKLIVSASRKSRRISDNITPEELVALSASNRDPAIGGVRKSDFSRLVELMHHCLNTGKGRIAGVKASGKKLVYGIFMTQVGGALTILLEGRTRESNEINTCYFVIDELIKANAGTSAILDFAGMSGKTSGSVGQSFGAVAVPYYRIYRNRLFWPVRIMK
jgi:hypothetical protein